MRALLAAFLLGAILFRSSASRPAAAADDPAARPDDVGDLDQKKIGVPDDPRLREPNRELAEIQERVDKGLLPKITFDFKSAKVRREAYTRSRTIRPTKAASAIAASNSTC